MYKYESKYIHINLSSEDVKWAEGHNYDSIVYPVSLGIHT